MTCRKRMNGRGALAPVALAFALMVSPLSLQAQEPTTPPPPVTPEKLAKLAEVFLEMSDARDDYFDRLGRTHDALGREQLLATHREAKAAILEAHEFTNEEYEMLIFVVSADQAQREEFDRLLAEIVEARGGGPA